MIKENDGLPQTVCMRCLGTLEFLCDFYDRCHVTQKELLEANRSTTEAKFQREIDAESDKENALPPANDAKRKAKMLFPDNSKSTKSCLAANNAPYYKTEKKEENSIHHETNNCASIDVEMVSKKQCTMDGLNVQEKKPTDEKKDKNVLNREINSKENEELCKTTAIPSTRSETINGLLNSTVKNTNETDIGIISDLPVRRKRGRKSKAQRLLEFNQSLICANVKEERQQDSLDKKSDDFGGRAKRHRLRAICMNTKSDAASTVVSTSKSRNENSRKSSGTLPHEFEMKTSNTTSSNVTVKNKVLGTESDLSNSEKVDACHKRLKYNTKKNDGSPVIVKKERVDVKDTIPQKTVELKSSIWNANEASVKNPENPKIQEEPGVKNTSPAPGDEAEKDKAINNYSDSTKGNVMDHSNILVGRENLRSATESNEYHVVVIESAQSNEIRPEVLENDCSEVMSIDGTVDQSISDSLDSDKAERSMSRRSSRDSSVSGNRSKDQTFGKISELISDEQKEIIETYYKVDMSIVNSKEVEQNITIEDKKNIRCNICGTLYFRLDKCQVHIWGHLNMKPYQCKACDFATVTVSNVRCHIRKSHLKIKPYSCQFCEKRYPTAVLLEEHLNTHTGARPFKCNHCDFASASRQMLSYHNATHKPMKDITCKICEKEFFSRGRLRAHMIIHNKDKVVMCTLCSAYLSNAEALETHHKNVHMRDYVCNVCGKRVKSRKALHNHQNVHAAAKYKCTLCPNVYKSSQILKEHLLKHEGIRKYKCDICGKTFAQQSHLAAHMAVHSKIRFHCPGCDKAFNRHDNMKIHTKRCKLFLANPKLKDLLTRKEKTPSINRKDKQFESSQNTSASDSVILSRSSSIDMPRKTVTDTEKTDTQNSCEIGLNISCIESAEHTWNSSVQAQDITNSATIDVIHITKVNDKLFPENEHLTVRENILGLESF